MAVQDYELLLRVRADMLEAIKGMDGLSASIGGAKVAADSVGESAAQASERIKKMVAATSQQAQVQESARSQAERAAQTANSTIKSYDDQAAAIRRASDAAAAYRARSAASGGSAAAAAALDTERAAMSKLAGQIDPTINALAKLDAQEKSLNAMRKAGVVGLDDYTRFQAVIDKNRASVTEAGKAMHTFSLNSALARREIGRLGTDIVNGNWGRFDQTALTLANYSGLMSVAFSPLGLAIGAVVGSLGAFAIAAAKVATENDKLNQSIQQTGNFAGTTTGQIDKMAAGITAANGSVSTSRAVLTQLVASGRVGAESLGALGQAAVDMAALTGQSTEKATAEVLKMFDGTAAGALKANDQYHFLTTSIYEQIKALEDEGDTQRAMEVEAEAFHQAAQARIEQMNQSLSGLARMWDTVKTSADNAWERMKTGASVLLGSADDQTKLFALMGKKMTAQEGGTNVAGDVVSTLGGGGSSALGTLLQQALSKVPGTRATWSAADEAELKALQDKIKAETQKADDDATRANINDSAVKADAGLDKLAASIDKAYGKKEKIKELDKYFTDLWAGADPNNAKLNGVQRFVNNDGSVGYSGGLYDTLLADINKKFDPKAKSTRGVDNAAATAHASLIKLLNDEQGAIDPVTKIWAKYNDTVSQANELADKASKGKGANVAAIHAERDAVIEVAAKVRDAALEKQADKDRLAFEKLRDSLSGIKSISFAPIVDDLIKLNKYLKDGTITAQEYKDTAGKVLDQNLPKLPNFKGADALTTGPFGELDKLDTQNKKLQDAYAAQLAALNAWHEQTLNSDQAFVDKENELYANHAIELQKIDDARNMVLMTGLTNSLAAAATVLKEGLGQQSALYRVAFAISKGAAIAEATLNLYRAISKASADLPYPANIGAMIAVASQGAALVSAIAGISAGFSEGGYTGPGGKYEYAGPAHKGEVIWSQSDVARAGGVDTVEAMRLGKRGYADGGYTGPTTDGFASRTELAMPDIDAATSRGQPVSNKMRVYVLQNEDQLAQRLAQHPATEKAIVAVAGENGTAIRAKW